MNDTSSNNSPIDMWYPSRIDIENCPMDYFNIKYVYGLDQDKMPPANAKMRSAVVLRNAL